MWLSADLAEGKKSNKKRKAEMEEAHGSESLELPHTTAASAQQAAVEEKAPRLTKKIAATIIRCDEFNAQDSAI